MNEKQFVKEAGMRLPKKVDVEPNAAEHEADKAAVLEALAEAGEEIAVSEDMVSSKKLNINYNASDLLVLTRAKYLATYIMTVTEKAPKRFRVVYVNRMQNHILDVLENIVAANFTRMDSDEGKHDRKKYQKQAYIKLKLLGYIAFLAYASGALNKKQYTFIAQNLSDVVSLLTAWGKSDAARKI
jgi:hypothetical protein